ncbi:MAG: tRNA (adenosine(37)-N6)-dimethylallyltransferase MiaA [bacterium]
MENSNQHKKLVIVLGATATGKTRLAVKLAKKFNGEIISADSRQVFRGMDIGTGKDLSEYGSQKAIKGLKKASGVPYHLIDIISPKTSFNVAKYQKLAYRAIINVQKQGKIPFLVGGTGLYIDAVINGYQFGENKKSKKQEIEIRKKLDKQSLLQLLLKLKKIDLVTYNKIDKKNRRRVQRALEIYFSSGKTKSESDQQNPPDWDILILGVSFSLEKIYQKIDSRLEDRLKEGMVREIKKLRRGGVSWKRLEEFGLEYRWVARYLQKKINYSELVENLRNDIHHFAKRQLTWFKRNNKIIWVSDFKTAEGEIKKILDP